jgi:Pyruvate/2-oxoacid:ferredoxin oxidoreductase delta subunit
MTRLSDMDGVISMYRKLVVFFMTGTGNSYKVAAWSAETAKENGLNSELHQVVAGKYNIPLEPQCLVVFTFPTHGFTAPWLMIKYALSLPRGAKTHVLILPSRAGIRVKGVFIPGLEGTAGYLIALLLWLKGFAVRGVMGVDMPSNWTAVHWGLNAANASIIARMAESKVRRAVQIVLEGNKHFDGIVQFTLGLLLAKISLMYLILGRLILAKLFFASEKCSSCALCQSICPKKAIKMGGGEQKRPYWTYACDSCMACMNFCPHQAIEVSPLIITAFYYLTSVPVVAYSMHFATERYGWSIRNGGLIEFGIQYVYVLVAIAIAYRFLYFILGSSIVRSILGKLSHTRYFRRYKAQGVSLEQIHTIVQRTK